MNHDGLDELTFAAVSALKDIYQLSNSIQGFLFWIGIIGCIVMSRIRWHDWALPDKKTVKPCLEKNEIDQDQDVLLACKCEGDNNGC